MHVAVPLDRYVLLTYELKAAHWAVTCLLLVSGWRVFPPFEEMALDLKLLYFSSLISMLQGKILCDPSIIVWVHLMHGVSACCGSGIYFFLAGHGQYLRCMTPAQSQRNELESKMRSPRLQQDTRK